MIKPILVLDFDGTIHSATSGWHGADVVTDPPVPGALQFIRKAQEFFRVAIFSSRSNQPGGQIAMRYWLHTQALALLEPNAFYGMDHPDLVWLDDIEWPTQKPTAFLSIDDRAIQFKGNWDVPELNPEELLKFTPWNQK